MRFNRFRSPLRELLCSSLIISLSACQGIDESSLTAHPLDDVPVGCVARRVDETRWEVDCLEDAPPQISSPDATSTPLPLELDAGLSDQEVSRDSSTVDALLDEDVVIELDADLPPLDMSEPEDMLPREDLPCDPPLELTASANAALPLSLIQLNASGGSGAWRFELYEDESGALVNESTGAYLSGPASGVVDVVKLTDSACLGEALINIRVVNGLRVAPQTATLIRGDQFEVEVYEGSGEVELSVIRAESGGELIDARTYRAGQSLGLDVLEARDLQTGEVVPLAFTVAAEAPIEVSPSVTAFPTGSWATLSPTGGSGHYDLITSPPLEADGMKLSASAATQQRVQVVDRFTGRSARIWVSALESLSAEIPPQNDHANNTIMRADLDLDQDGIKDAVISQSQADVEALNGGGIFIFLSSDAEEGERYPRAPSQVFAGTGRRYEAGRGVALADVNQDQRPDLIYGARGADLGGRDSGAIYIHFGVEGGRFSDDVSVTLSAGQNDDHLGASVAVCDINGDGLQDVIGGAIFYEDRRQDPVNWNEGALFVFLNSERGLSLSPDQTIPGMHWTTDEALRRLPHLNYGHALTAGDFNGDGLCDVATSEVSWSASRAGGGVYIHAGRPADEWSLGGLTATPVAVIKSDDPLDQSGNLGRRVVSGDLTGDGLDDLVISHYAADRAGPNAGAAHVFYGGGALSWSDQPEDAPEDDLNVLSAYDAEWTIEGNAYDHMSSDLSVIDYDGEPPLDLMVMSLYGDSDLGWDSGTLQVYLGSGDGLASDPTLSISGPQQAFQLFESATYLGDVDDDGVPEWFARSNRLGSEHFHYGEFFLVTAAPPEPEEPPLPEREEGGGGDDSITSPLPPYTGALLFSDEEESRDVAMWPLELPLNASGAQFGYSVAWVGDFDRDGYEDAIATASHATYSENDGASGEINAGGIWFFAGGPRGALTDGVNIGRFPGFSSWDHVKGVTSAGDFNGDGHPDFAVVLGNDERPSTWSSDQWFNVDEANCMSLGYDQGGVYLFLGGFDADLRPDLVFYGDVGGLVPEAITGGFDYNGDGFSDLAVGAIRRDLPGANDAGGVDVVFGRALSLDLARWPGPAPRPLQVICDADRQLFGSAASDHFGFSLTGMNDLNDDGCDELAVGARLADGSGQQQQGAAYVFFGEGTSGCLSSAQGLVIESDQAYIQLGTSLAAGDLDGDGLDELAIGAPHARVDGIGFGGAWVMPGSMMASATRVSVDALMDYDSAGRAQARLWFDSFDEQRWFAVGSSQSSEAGRGVALITRDAPERGALALGEVMGSAKGVSGLGGVRVFQLNPDGGFSATPDAELWGEARRPESRMSEGALSASPYSSRLLVGAREGGGVGLDHGSVYLFDLEALWSAR